MLIANAGSGKTHALTTRMIRLMLLGVDADKIAALTFTRKSAGEFLEKLLQRIAVAADDVNELNELKAATGMDQLTADHCRHLLAHIISRFGRLGLGTIDRFFARMARQFPLESGLPEDFSIADRAAMESARERALAARFSVGAGDEEALQAMIGQFRQISRKHGERNVFRTLLSQVEQLHIRYRETPDGLTWGDTKSIWGTARHPFDNAGEIAPAAENFRRAIKETHPDLSSEAIDQLDQEIAAINQFIPGRPWKNELKTVFNKRLIKNPSSGRLQLTRKKTGRVKLNPQVEAARQELLEILLKDVFGNLLERTRGIHAFMGEYESVYAQLVRNAGLVTFSDITEMLAGRAGETVGFEEADLWRTHVAYRIDQEFDHWLLDEFQDTSRKQWQILSTFIGEVLMDDSGTRSFFYVGDTKQAIYGWRGGDSDLFHEIQETYSEAIDVADPLTTSWRSSVPIINLVNAVFGDLTTLAEPLDLSQSVVKKWQAGWNEHYVADPHSNRVGYASWRSVENSSGGGVDPQFIEVLNILREVDPLSRGINCAVLLRKNDAVATLAALLQSEGFPVAVEGKSNPCLDNPLGLALIAALRTAAHPDDTLSAAIAGGFCATHKWGLDDTVNFRRNTLQSLAENGYAATLRNWIRQLNLGEDEPFLADRAETLLAAADAFDASRTPSDGITQFLAGIEALEIQESEASGALRLMTVHQAKGLGFEMVIVAGLDKSGTGNTSDRLILGPDKRTPHWGILLPSKDIAAKDPVLRAQQEIYESESDYNSICTAYVALTRPKTALYIISNALADTTKATHFGRHLKETLDAQWQDGDPEWYRTFSHRKKEISGENSAPLAFIAPKNSAPRPSSPSQKKTVQTWTKASGASANTGTAVHQLLEQVEWMEEAPRQKETDDEATRLTSAFLSSPAAEQIFSRPDQATVLWRERAFEVLLEGQWLSGTFDRVHLLKDSKGIISGADLIDYKTDRIDRDNPVEQAVARHRPQMECYRLALSQLTGLHPESIRMTLVFIRACRTVSLEC